MSASTSAKSSSGRRNAGNASKTVTKRSSKQKPKWKVVGNKVHLLPGDYTINDFEAMLKAIKGTRGDSVNLGGRRDEGLWNGLLYRRGHR